MRARFKVLLKKFKQIGSENFSTFCHHINSDDGRDFKLHFFAAPGDRQKFRQANITTINALTVGFFDVSFREFYWVFT